MNRSGLVIINQSTISGNVAEARGGGIEIGIGTLELIGSIVAGNTRGNIEGTPTISTLSLTSGDPMLAPLGYYGGPTQTMPPMPGSPALDAGIATGNTPATDQRGLLRIIGAGLDIGACEAQGVDVGAISSISLTPSGLRLTIPPVYFLRDVGVGYSPDLSPGSWIELGNFFLSVEVGREFTDSDTVRIARPSGYYRAFLRPIVP